MNTLFQWCETCKTETVFNYATVTCTVCGGKCKNFNEKKK